MLLTNKTGYGNANASGNVSKLSPCPFIVCFVNVTVLRGLGIGRVFYCSKVWRGFCSSVSARETQSGFPACLSHVRVLLKAAPCRAVCRWGVTKCLLSASSCPTASS